MVFRVEISPEALSDIDKIAAYIREQGSFESAERWFNGIIDAILSLCKLPGRCAAAEESTHFRTEVRVLLYGKRSRRYKTISLFIKRPNRCRFSTYATGQ
jgi:plasmid stabilization system protein ParE